MSCFLFIVQAIQAGIFEGHLVLSRAPSNLNGQITLCITFTTNSFSICFNSLIDRTCPLFTHILAYELLNIISIASKHRGHFSTEQNFLLDQKSSPFRKKTTLFKSTRYVIVTSDWVERHVDTWLWIYLEVGIDWILKHFWPLEMISYTLLISWFLPLFLSSVSLWLWLEHVSLLVLFYMSFFWSSNPSSPKSRLNNEI